MQIIRCDICKNKKETSPAYNGLPWRKFEYISFHNDTYMSISKNLCPICFKEVMTSANYTYEKLMVENNKDQHDKFTFEMCGKCINHVICLENNNVLSFKNSDIVCSNFVLKDMRQWK